MRHSTNTRDSAVLLIYTHLVLPVVFFGIWPLDMLHQPSSRVIILSSQTHFVFIAAYFRPPITKGIAIGDIQNQFKANHSILLHQFCYNFTKFCRYGQPNNIIIFIFTLFDFTVSEVLSHHKKLQYLVF